MRRFGLICLLLAAAVLARAEPVPPARSAADIRKEMSAIRRGTTWSDPAAAKAANDKIAQLAKELAGIGSTPAGGASAGGTSGAATANPEDGGVDPAKFRAQLAIQMGAAAGAGKEGDKPLAKLVREQIVEEYKADVDPTVKNPDVLAEQTTLVIDFSSPAAEAVVKQMENFRGITTLVVTGGATNAAGDVAAVLRQAAGYPLRELYLVDFRQHLTALPPEAMTFTQLRLLAVFDNALDALPPEVGALRDLETLLVDANPIATVLPVVRSLPKLASLGLGKTGVGAAEQAEIRRLMPDCRILTQ